MRITDIKHCSKCKTHKHRDEFNNSSYTHDGKNAQCRVCSSAARNASYEKKASKIDEKRLRHLVGLGCTPVQIAKRFGVTTAAIGQAIKRIEACQPQKTGSNSVPTACETAISP